MITLKTNYGDISIALNTDKSPVTCRNFLNYCQQGFYQGTIFHRVIKGKIIQGGGFTDQMIEKEGNSPIVNEANRGLRNTTGTIAMARTDAPHSATSQFFINISNNKSLNYHSATNNGWGYTVFGQVTLGMDIVKAIAEVEIINTAEHDHLPKQTVIIEEVVIKEA
ncbi:peptidylprolyl isomerase [Vibrio sp. SS-MA-C1-2]|uniref:peptidylprolyl isomerase n=1 Tax=Vibrio sp. SS-MA-C1-2 TaxID=2908646 RepID=UPI001F3E21E6|nr:peptidylprolyl isomerase [Vibrio sp. SS-MA-C1-2]UJF19492.1 peptidylprolyl isomerase [Vibrio sp. SS-MA-C1-2]